MQSGATMSKFELAQIIEAEWEIEKANKSKQEAASPVFNWSISSAVCCGLANESVYYFSI